MLRYVICDDDPNHLQFMFHSLSENATENSSQIALLTQDPGAVLEYAKTAQPNTLYFLDLKLDDSKEPAGLQLCRLLLSLDPNAYVVFVSAYPQYALVCCQSHAFDFLLKPFTKEQLKACVQAVTLDIARRGNSIAN
ncbi:MAG: response regulator [Eubacteriales bacterium]|nr:response regulator [Eubacteriales bacterium]